VACRFGARAPSSCATGGQAIRRIEAVSPARPTPVPSVPLALPGFPGSEVCLEDESSHPTGSLEHRLARPLILYALAHGRLHARSTWPKP